MLSVVSVSQSVNRSGPHVTITHDALDLTLQGPLPGADIWWLLKHTRLAQVGDTYPTAMLSCLI